MKRLAMWIEAQVQRMQAENKARRERIFRKQFPPETELKPPAHRSRSQANR